ncbi:hypothetical protein ACIQXD_05085 [Streptomyces uncialis]|uniref:hypothetical protein n=1 Tax=Streptomyces uncialis TaxID=1048205 RepID=UPI00382A4920
MPYAITVHEMGQRAGRIVAVGIALITRAESAPEMETAVTLLHRKYPTPCYQVEVEALR